MFSDVIVYNDSNTSELVRGTVLVTKHYPSMEHVLSSSSVNKAKAIKCTIALTNLMCLDVKQNV